MLRSVLSRRRVGLALTAAVIATGLVPIGAAAHAAPDAGSHTEQTPQAAAAPTTLTMHGIGLGGVLNTQVCDFNGDGYGDLGASVRDGFSSAEWSDSEAEQNAAGVTSTYQPRSAQWSNAISDTTKTRRCIGDINGDGYDDVLETSAAGVRSVSVNLYGSAPNAAGKLGDKRFANFSFPATAQFTNPAFGAIGAGAAGDLDGDGLGDFAFSQHLASSGGRTGNGRIWVLAGRSGDLSSTVQTHTMNEAAVQDPSLVVMTIDGAAAGEQLGRIASAGDVDGDGVDDLMVASESAKRIWVIRGQARGAAARQIDLAQLDPNDGWLFATAPSAGSGSAGTSFGSAISVLDDVNGDRVPDYLIGLTSTRTGAGGAVVVFGAAGAAAAAHTVDVDLVARTVTGNGQARGYVITPEGSTDGFGFAVAGLGDVNGDGRSDLLIGAPGYDPVGSTGSKLVDAGAAYVLYGKGSSETQAVTELDEAHGYRIDGRIGDAVYAGKPGNFGSSVARIGDIDKNGAEDFAIGAPTFAHLTAAQTGAVFVALRGTIARSLELAASRREGDDQIAVRTDEVRSAGETFDLSANLRLSTLRGQAGTVAFGVDGAPVAGGVCDAVEASGPRARQTHRSIADCEPSDGIVLNEFGAHEFTADSAASAGFTAAHSSLRVYISDSSRTALQVTQAGSTVKLRATVSAASSSRSVNDGSVDFAIEGVSVDSCAATPVLAGVAECEAPAPQAGTRGYTAAFSGITVNGDGESGSTGADAITVLAPSQADRDSSRVTIAAPRLSRSSYVYGSATRATVSAQVSGLGSGSVDLYAGSKRIARVPVRGGAASAIVPKNLAAGRYAVTAVLPRTADHAEVRAQATAKLTVKRAGASSMRITAQRFVRGTKPRVTVRIAKLSNGSYPTGRVKVRIGSYTKTVKLKAAHRGRIVVTAKRVVRSSKVSAAASYRPADTSNVSSKRARTITIRSR